MSEQIKNENECSGVSVSNMEKGVEIANGVTGTTGILTLTSPSQLTLSTTPPTPLTALPIPLAPPLPNAPPPGDPPQPPAPPQPPPLPPPSSPSEHQYPQPPPPPIKPNFTGIQPIKNHVCRDHLRGNCTRPFCKFSHAKVEKKEKPKSEIEFCHDYQNKKSCMRIDCKYIHCTPADEKRYNDTGEIPICKDFVDSKCNRGLKCPARHIDGIGINSITPMLYPATPTISMLLPPSARPLSASGIPTPRNLHPVPTPVPSDYQASNPIRFDLSVPPPVINAQDSSSVSYIASEWNGVVDFERIQKMPPPELQNIQMPSPVKNSSLYSSGILSSTDNFDWKSNVSFRTDLIKPNSKAVSDSKHPSGFFTENLIERHSEPEVKKIKLSDPNRECDNSCFCRTEDESYWDNKVKTAEKDFKSILDQLISKRVEMLMKPPSNQLIGTIVKKNVNSSQYEMSPTQVKMTGTISSSVRSILSNNTNQISNSNAVSINNQAVICNPNSNTNGNCSPYYIVLATPQQINNIDSRPMSVSNGFNNEMNISTGQTSNVQTISNSIPQAQLQVQTSQPQQLLMSQHNINTDQQVLTGSGSQQQQSYAINQQTMQQPITIAAGQFVFANDQGRQLTNQQMPGHILMCNNKGA